MDLLATEDPKLTHHSAPAGYWGWEPDGKSISIQISLDVVDRMLTSIIDGFGSIPKRGAEVGGLLLGIVTPGDPLVYRIEEFTDVPCLHKFGPSYVFSEEDHKTLHGALEKAGRDRSGLKVLGFYRSHTREGLYLAPEDLELARRYFPDQNQIALLVRPSAMQVSHGGFFYREEDAFQQATYLEFPFRRSELETGAAPVRRPLGERLRGEQGRRPMPSPQFAGPGREPYAPPQPQTPAPQHSREPFAARPMSAAPAPPYRRDEMTYAGTAPVAASQPQEQIALPYASRQGEADIPMPSQVYAVTTPAQSRFRKGWYWLPLSFIFLLLGVLLGFQSAMTIYPASRGGTAAEAYSLGLSITRSGDSVTVRWDRSNTAVKVSKRGALVIADGKYSKRVELDAADLQKGSVIYNFSTTQLKFTLEVFPQEGVALSETGSWTGGS
ncbi:MAG TPA: hypothetical protein VGL53_18495 [Bryobacteraceae bacterium]|jgi:hypothetical protein